MRIHNSTTWDIETGECLADDSYEYAGPVALCDRSLYNQARNASTNAAQGAGQYGAQAGQIYSNLAPGLEHWFTQGGPGYSPLALQQRETEALATGAGAGEAARNRLELMARRTGNQAALGANEVGAAQMGAQATGRGIENALAQNAALQAQEQQRAAGLLSGLYGTGMRGQVGMSAQQAQDMRDAAEAERVGWLQNLTGLLGAAGSTMSGFGRMGSMLGLGAGK